MDFDTFDYPASARQIEYIQDLRDGFEDAKRDYCQLIGVEYVAPKWGPLPTGREEASATIDQGKAAVTEMRRIRNDARATAREAAEIVRQELTEGMWILGDWYTGRIFKVQRAVHGSGNLYAKELIAGTGEFDYVPGIANQLVTEGRPMTLEEAKAYGALYGTCCVCGRTLTNETSIAAGIGPVCASKF